jgi:glycosyltransferase involved in cell wall biosynthesis
MSVFNGEQYLVESIESILRQSFADFEFLIIDDGSTDRSGSIIASFDDTRIRLISRANRGLTASLNEGIKAAKGEFIARQDADDISLPTRLEREVEYLDHHPTVGMVGTNYVIIDAEGGLLRETSLFTHPADLALAQMVYNQFGHGSVMIRRAVLDVVGGYNAHVGHVEDHDLFCRIGSVCELANLAEPLYLWRQTSTGVSSAKHELQARQALAVRDRMFREEVIRRRRPYKVLSSIHPLSFRPGVLAYLEKKSALCRGAAWLYHQEGMRSYAIKRMFAAAMFAPWRRRNYRFLYRLLRSKTNKPLWEFEFI